MNGGDTDAAGTAAEVATSAAKVDAVETASVKTEEKPDSPVEVKAEVKTEVKAEVQNVAVKEESNGKKAMSDDDGDDDDDSDSDSDSSEEEPIIKKLAAKKTVRQIPKKQIPTKKSPTKPAVKRAAPAAKPPAKKKPKITKKESSSEESSSEDSSSSSDDSSSNSDDDVPLERRRKTRKAAPAKQKKPSQTMSNVNPVSKYTMRAANAPLVANFGANKWWRRASDKYIKWKTLEHNGPRFPPMHVPHQVPLKYNGNDVVLSPAAEEVATFYATMLETDFMQKPIFNKNFFRDFRKNMTEDERTLITDLEKCGFREIHEHVMRVRDEKKEQNKEAETKKRLKEEKEDLVNVYGTALVDGYLEQVGNFRVEPPALFRGRGEHPKTGTLKTRVVPEDVVINIGKGVEIPKAPEGHTWKGVIHNNKVTWLAYWQDNVNGDYKYVYLSANSRFKGESDMKKYKKARVLCKYIDRIRKNYNADMGHSDMEKRQMAVALYALDVLALRVGNEKDLDERADTVGLCSLRCEHITFPEANKIRLNFLGKDSMVYDNIIEVPTKVFNNFKDFAAKKQPKDDLFDKLTPGTLNTRLKEIMPGLSAKVFRTYNASVMLEKQLAEPPQDDAPSQDTLDNEKVLYYNRANREVAILCNHQRSVPKGYEEQVGKMGEKLDEQKAFLAELKAHLKGLKSGKAPKKKKKNNAPEIKMPATADQCKTRIKKLEEQIANQETKIALKSDNKTVALGTSKINYMDPRVTIAWCKAVDLPLEKVFNKSLVSKFPWAMEVHSKWSFVHGDRDVPKENRQIQAEAGAEGDEDEEESEGEE